jgi:hypothetical protein
MAKSELEADVQSRQLSDRSPVFKDPVQYAFPGKAVVKTPAEKKLISADVDDNNKLQDDFN